MDNDRPRETAVQIFKEALEAVDPYKLVQNHCESISAAYYKEDCQKLYLVSFGKAAFAMASALTESPVGKLITRGIIITKYGHAPGALEGNIEMYEAGHPVPDSAGFAATRRVMEMLRSGSPHTITLCLISGGGSALMVAPCDGITLGEKQQVTELLLRAGADINELNTVRKHISGIKGGRLAEIAYPSKVMSLILSDVIGDPIDVIASGPTAADESTFRDALNVIGKYHLTDKIPDRILNRLTTGAKGIAGDTPKKGDRIFERVENIIIGSNKIATDAAARKAVESGFKTTILSHEIQGEARDAAKWLAQKVREIKGRKTDGSRICLISGGETTVKVRGKGIGGRNTELALAFALEMAGVEGVTLLSAGTDGTDGPTDAAGAIVDGHTIGKAEAKGLHPDVYLDQNDSYTYFKNTGELLITGSTGTNVMDIQIILLT
jgi:hydroxypyruvate reductase/glycerate 2-kinase